ASSRCLRPYGNRKARSAMDTDHEVALIEHGDWRVGIYLAWVRLEQRFAGRAELHLARVMRCRIGLGWGIDSEPEAIASLRGRAIGFIGDWHSRKHDADSEFSEL